MTRNRISRKPIPGYNISLDAALKQGGFYGKEGTWNSLVKIDGKILRGRVETLVFKKDSQQVFMHITNYNKKRYRIPGGSFEKDVPNYIQAENEVNEEARLNIKNLVNTGQHYIKIYKDKKPYDDVDDRLMWDGSYTEIYVAEYDGPYTGHIDERDKDNEMYKNGKFYNLHEVYPILYDIHKKIIDNIFPIINKGAISESMIILQESNNEIHYYPYYTPREMSKLGVFNESKNRYSDIEDEAIGWYLEYTDTLINPDSENWLKELQDRYNTYIKEPTLENKQAILHLGWNPEIPVTLENVLKASDKTEKRINDKESHIVTIDENLIFSKKDMSFNIDDFDSGKSNIILITGMSGSGKTTLSRKIADMYEAKIIHLDHFQNYYGVMTGMYNSNHISDRYIESYMKQNPKVKERAKDFSDIDLRGFEQYFVPFFKWLIKELEKDKNNKYVVEGIHIMLYIPYKDIKTYPLHCINTSTIRSMARHWVRDKWGLNEMIRYGYDDILSFIRWNNQYDKFRDSVYESSINRSKLSVIDINKDKSKAVKYLKQKRSNYTKYIDNYDGEIIIDTDKDIIVGQVFIGNSGKDEGFITGLWVRDSYRGNGIGKQLLDDAVQKYNGIDLTVEKDNKVALDMYKNYGFVIIGKGNSNREYWMRNGNLISNTLNESASIYNPFDGSYVKSIFTKDDFIITAKMIQSNIDRNHSANKLLSVQNRDIESDDGGWIFAQYHAKDTNDGADIINFIDRMNNIINNSQYCGKIETPECFPGTGLLMLREE